MGDLQGGFRELPPRLEDLTAAVTFLNELGWSMSWGEVDGRWLVLTGDQALYKAETREDVEGFLMGLAASVMLLEANDRVRLPRPGPRPTVHSSPLTPEGRWDELWPETR